MRFLPPAVLSIAAAFALMAAPAWGQQSRGVYTVSDVSIDVTSQDSSRARELGFAQAQQLAFNRLAKRLTLPDDLARIGAPNPSQSQLDQIVDGVDIQQESRSGVRYIARMAVNFDPNGVRNILKNKGLNVVDTRTAPILVVPVFSGGTADQAAAWRLAWEQGGFAEELAPVAVAAPDVVTGVMDWNAVQAAAAPAGAASALYAVARVDAGAIKVRLTEVSASGPGRDRGELSTPWTATPNDNGAAVLKAMAVAANDRVQAEWKLRLAAGAGQRARIAATASFKTQAEWLLVKRALAQATQTLVSDIQIEAVANDGASLSFSHLGTVAQLAAELGRYGVAYEARGAVGVLRATSP